MNTSHRTARILMSLLFCTFMVHFADAGTQWARTIGGPSYDGTRSIQRTSDGGYILAGVTNSFGAGGSDAWCVKLDSSGNVLWQKTYGVLPMTMLKACRRRVTGAISSPEAPTPSAPVTATHGA